MKDKPKFQFSNVVVVGDSICVILKTWNTLKGSNLKYNYDVYVRSLNLIANYSEQEISHFVFSKELSDDEKEFY